jgi:hypothetical protein
MKTYRGSCHCGAVKFSAEIDLSGDTRKCNCTWCRKARNWFVLVAPEAFRLDGKPSLSTYQFGKKTLKHEFCPTCGIHAFGHSNSDIIPADKAWVYINVATLDDATLAELTNAPVKAVDGANDADERELANASTL